MARSNKNNECTYLNASWELLSNFCHECSVKNWIFNSSFTSSTAIALNSNGNYIAKKLVNIRRITGKAAKAKFANLISNFSFTSIIA